MLQIIIHDDDAMFYAGMTHLLNDLFRRGGKTPCYSRELNKFTVSKADIIIQPLRPGEAFLCYPELYYRKPGLIIGLVENEDITDPHPLPLCVNDRVFINRKAKTAVIRQTIKNAWDRLQASANPSRHPHCYGCKHRTLTSQQKRVAAAFINGESVVSTATKLALNSKSVFAHKHSLMRKFHLKNDHQLVTFLTIQRVKQQIVRHVGE